MEDDSLRPITTVKDVVIDPDSGKLLALIVDVGKNLIISPVDIFSWQDAIFVHHGDIFVEGGEVLRVKKAQETGIKIFNNKVETQDGKYLGKVVDFSLDSMSFGIKKLYVAKGFLGLVRYDSRLITAKNIIEILPNKIVVKNDQAHVKEKRREVALEDMALG